jgi:hypothetical protein
MSSALNFTIPPRRSSPRRRQTGTNPLNPPNVLLERAFGAEYGPGQILPDESLIVWLT